VDAEDEKAASRREGRVPSMRTEMKCLKNLKVVPVRKPNNEEEVAN
jgi:hypothetical protein